MEKIAEAPRSNSKSVEPDEISSRQVPVYPTGWRLALILAALLFGTLLVAIDNTIIGVAVPKITTDFRALDDVGWYSSAYLIAVTALQPSYGNIYKFFHVKLTYLAAIVIFEGNGWSANWSQSRSRCWQEIRRIGSLRSSAQLRVFHNWSSSSRYRGCWNSARSFGFYHSDCSPAEKTTLFQYRLERLCIGCLRGPDPGRSDNGSFELEMVLLDVSLHQVFCQNQALITGQKSPDRRPRFRLGRDLYQAQRSSKSQSRPSNEDQVETYGWPWCPYAYIGRDLPFACVTMG